MKENSKRLEYENLLDEELLRLAAMGEGGDRTRGATEELLRRSYGWMRRVSFYAARDVAEGEECLQEALLEIARSLPRFRGDSSLKTWMYVIIRRVSSRRRRKSFFLGQRFPLGSEKDVASEGDRGGEEVVVRRRADVLLELAEEHRKLWRLVQTLPEKQRMAILLHYSEDLSVAEVAEALQCSESAVKTHLMRGREKLREQLSADERTEDK